MNKTKATLIFLIAGFVLFIVGALREIADPIAAARESSLMPRAMAAEACDVPRADALAQRWVVASTGCTSNCKQTHLQVGDVLAFDKDVSGELNFSLDVKPAKSAAARLASRTAGYALRSDGVGNVSGPIVFEHSVLDGSPLQLHWLIVKLRNYDADGLGKCELHARMEICNDEPAPGATSCSDQQHAGAIHLDPY